MGPNPISSTPLTYRNKGITVIGPAKIKNKLKWRPRTNFRQGIKLTFDWYYKNKRYYKSLTKKDIVKRLGKG